MKVIVVTTTCRDEDEQELVDGLLNFVKHDPWTVGSWIDRRDPNPHDRSVFADIYEELETEED